MITTKHTQDRLENEETAELCRNCGLRIRYSAEGQYCLICIRAGCPEDPADRQ